MSSENGKKHRVDEQSDDSFWHLQVRAAICEKELKRVLSDRTLAMKKIEDLYFS